MSRLEDLQPTAAIRGILPGSLVTVVSVQWFGSEALELTYKTPAGEVANELLHRHDEPRIEVVERWRRRESVISQIPDCLARSSVLSRTSSAWPRRAAAASARRLRDRPGRLVSSCSCDPHPYFHIPSGTCPQRYDAGRRSRQHAPPTRPGPFAASTVPRTGRSRAVHRVRVPRRIASPDPSPDTS